MIPSLKEQMAEYVLNAIHNYRFNTATYVDQKREGFWRYIMQFQSLIVLLE